MTDDQKPRVLLIPHEAIPESGSFEVRYPDGRQSEYFYFEDNPAPHAPPWSISASGRKVTLRERVLAMRHRRPPLIHAGPTASPSLLVEIGLKAKK